MRDLVLSVAVAAFATVSLGGCSPPVIVEDEDGPTFALSADQPVAEFAVTLCYEGPTGHRFATEAHVYADLTLENADPATAVFGQSYLEGDDPVDAPPPHDFPEFSPTDRFAADFPSRTEGSLGFDVEASDLADTGGCLPPRIVRFEIGDAPDDYRIEVEWRTSLSLDYHRKAPDEDTLSVEIERI